jgi:hypothetical protein
MNTNRQEDGEAGELLYSKFFHRDSRPIDGLSDPHWHVHCFLHNATFDPVEDTRSRFFAACISAPNRTAISCTMRQAEWSDSIRARREASIRVSGGP